MTGVRGGLIQMGLKADTGLSPLAVRDRMNEAHAPLIEEAGRQGVQVLCLQEVFNQPYFCPSQDARWHAAAEQVPDGPTTRLMQEHARRPGMVIVAPIYEEEVTGVYYNTAAVIDADGRYLGKLRKIHIPRVAGFYEKLFFKPGNLGYPVFETAFCRLGVYTCHDRHFPDGWRAVAPAGAEYIVNPSATVAGLSQYLWKLEQPAAAVANGCFIGAVNRVGTEAPLEHRRALWQELHRRPARQSPLLGERGPGRARLRRHGSRPDPRGPQSLAALPRPQAGDLRGAGGTMSMAARPGPRLAGP